MVDSHEPSDLFPVVYQELKAIAARYHREWGQPGAVQPTSLVHEAYERLVKARGEGFADVSHFRAVAALAMRQVLLDRARRQGAAKRGGDWQQVTLTGLGESVELVDVLALDQALAELEALDPRGAKIVVLRFFGGLTVPEVADTLDVSTRLVEREWRSTRAWLRARLGRA